MCLECEAVLAELLMVKHETTETVRWSRMARADAERVRRAAAETRRMARELRACIAARDQSFGHLRAFGSRRAG
jgi:hypothetical protein